MGQYYMCINLDKHEYVSPDDYGNGTKLMEHSFLGNNFLCAVENLLSPKGKWHQDRIVWAGDYMDPKVYLEGIKTKDDNDNLYYYAYDHFSYLIDTPDNDDTLRYIINHTKKQYVDTSKIVLKLGDNYTTHPLSILTSSGNGRGGGDYFSDTYKEHVGVWAGDSISTDTDKPNGYSELNVYFEE